MRDTASSVNERPVGCGQVASRSSPPSIYGRASDARLYAFEGKGHLPILTALGLCLTQANIDQTICGADWTAPV
jgi:hypothetical protein